MNLRNLLVASTLLLAVPVATVLASSALSGSDAKLRIWTWSSLGWVAMGIPFLLMQKQAGFPAPQPGGPAVKKHWTKAVLAGLLFGVLDVFVMKLILHPQAYTEMPPFLQPFPYSLLLYTSGALEIEVMYRLIPLTMAMLIALRFATPVWQVRIFWIAAVFTSLREPLEQWPVGPAWLLAYAFATGFGMNLLQAVFFRRGGFLASLSVRLGHYLVWHILLGLYVQFVELPS